MSGLQPKSLVEAEGMSLRAKRSNHELAKQYWGFAMRPLVLPPSRAVISGTISDEKGEPIPNADVRLEQDWDRFRFGW